MGALFNTLLKYTLKGFWYEEMYYCYSNGCKPYCEIYPHEYLYTYALFKSHVHKCLQIFCVTRFIMTYYVLEIMMLVHLAIVETIGD